MDNYRTPAYVSRVWCIYELYNVVHDEIPCEVILPLHCQPELRDDLNAPGGFDRTQEFLSTIDVENATAYFARDAEDIKAKIRSTVGIRAVNAAARNFLGMWLGKQVTKQLCSETGFVGKGKG